MKGLARNVANLAGGGIVAQVISLLAMPVLTRLYSTYDFGLFSTFASIVLIIAPISTLRFNSALLIAPFARWAHRLFILSFASVLAFALAVALVALLLVQTENAGELGGWLLWLPLGVFVVGAMQTLQSLVLRRKDFRGAAYGQIAESVADRALAIGVGAFFGSVVGGLVFGRILGLTSNMSVLVTRLRARNVWTELRHQIRMRGLRAVASRYRAFPLVSSWAFLANSAARELPVILIAMLFGAPQAGFYGLGLRVLNVPILTVGDALAKVTLARVRERRKRPELLRDMMLKLLGVIIYLVMPLVIVILFYGDRLFATVFGAQWVEAGLYAALLAPVILFMLVYRVASSLFDLFDRQRARLLTDISLLIVRVASLLVVGGVLGKSIAAALLVMMVAVSVVYMVAIGYLFRLATASVRDVGWVAMRKGIFLLSTVGGCLIVSALDLERQALLFGIVLVGIVQYAVILLLDRQFSLRALLDT